MATNTGETRRSSLSDTTNVENAPVVEDTRGAPTMEKGRYDDSKVPFLTARTFFMCILVSMGGICFGYDTGQVNNPSTLFCSFQKPALIHPIKDQWFPGNGKLPLQFRRYQRTGIRVYLEKIWIDCWHAFDRNTLRRTCLCTNCKPSCNWKEI